jgi:HD-GYP domain-containing protein (c-di-GMP phosphodiesterase class II)
MGTSIAPINAMAQLLQDISRQLHTLDELAIPSPAREHVRIIVLRRLARQMETPFPHHFGHGERTARAALALGAAAGLTAAELQDLHYAALLHDIGLLAIPKHLVEADQPLDLDDYALVQSHPRAGAQILSPLRFLREAARLVAFHHERWDGTGYPYGLRGEYVPFPARILGIADVFDSLTIRSGSAIQSLRLLQASSGTQFDPGLITRLKALPLDQLSEEIQPGEPPRVAQAKEFGVGRALPLRQEEGASVPPEVPSSSH